MVTFKLLLEKEHELVMIMFDFVLRRSFKMCSV